MHFWEQKYLGELVLQVGCRVHEKCHLKYQPTSPYMLSAMVSLYLEVLHKMFLGFGKVEGTLAACPQVGFHLSPATDSMSIFARPCFLL